MNSGGHRRAARAYMNIGAAVGELRVESARDRAAVQGELLWGAFINAINAAAHDRGTARHVANNAARGTSLRC